MARKGISWFESGLRPLSAKALSGFFMCSSFALVNRKHLLAKLWCHVFHKAVSAQFNGVVLSELQQVGFNGIRFSGVDADLGDHIDTDFSEGLAMRHLVSIQQQHALRAFDRFQKAIGTTTEQHSAEANKRDGWVHGEGARDEFDFWMIPMG